MGKITDLSRKLRKNMTQAEKMLWEKLRNKNISNAKFLRQKPIIYKVLNGEKYFFIVDFCCYNPKIIVEVDGGIHKQQKDYDREKDSLISALGFKILRFENEQVMHNIDEVVARISHELSFNSQLLKRK